MICSTFEMVNENSLQKFCDVQSGSSGDIICRMGAKRGVGTLKACGLMVKKIIIWFLDNWSAVVLYTPGIWLAAKRMSK